MLSLEKGEGVAQGETKGLCRLADALGKGLYLTELNGTILHVNGTFCQMVGEETPETPRGQSILSYHPQGLGRRFTEVVLPAVIERGHWTGEFALQPKHGDLLRTLDHLFLVCDDQGMPRYIAAMLDIVCKRKVDGGDLTARHSLLESLVSGCGCDRDEANISALQEVVDRKRIEEDLQAARDRYRSLVENIDLGITLISRDHRILMTNAQVSQWFDRPAHDFLGKFCYAEFERRPEVCGHCPGVRAMDSGRPEAVETEGVREDGSRIAVRVRAFPLFEEDGTPNGFIEVIEDITGRKLAEDELRLAATAFEAQEAIAITDQDAHILRVNSAFLRMTGYDPEEILGRRASIFQSESHDDAFYGALGDAVKETGHWQGEIWIRRKDGESIPGLLSISAVRNEEGKVTHYVAAFNDIAQIKQQQKRIEQTAAEEHTLGLLLRCALAPLDMAAFLQQALDTLLESIPWLSFLPKGGVFLTEDEGRGNTLELVASRHLGVPERTCARVPFGKCLCGRAADEGAIAFAGSVDDRHAIRYEGMEPHGHYSVPIPARDGVYGVIVLYLPNGHPPTEHETAFLVRVADVLSMGISRRYMETQIDYQAYHDGLTGLVNRRLLLSLLRQSLGLAARRKSQGALLYIDLDGFKPLNDSLGPSLGDDLLRQFAARLVQQVRSSDTVARIGGDEFAVLLPALGGESQTVGSAARAVAEKLRAAVSGRYHLQDHEYHLTVSIGVVPFSHEEGTGEDVLKHAETAMFRAKANGRDSLQFYRPDMQAAVDSQFRLEKDLRLAIARGELSLHYQPQVDEAGRPVGAEALLRWRHPERGMVSPGEFIPVAEDTGLILPMGAWVLREACRQLREWREAGIGDLLPHLAVNLSPKQFYQPDFVSEVKEILASSGVDPSNLVLEVTEGVVIQDVERTIEKMQTLKSLGITFSIDDFGVGYSSLTYLKRLPLDVLKIDQSFVRGIGTDPGDAAIVETIIAMARHLGLKTVAEGVETEQQLQFLKAKGCHHFQGYYFSRPVPNDEFVSYLSQHAQGECGGSAGVSPESGQLHVAVLGP